MFRDPGASCALFLTTVLLWAAPDTAVACSCGEIRTIGSSLDQADAVVIGRVVYNPRMARIADVRVEVVDPLKGGVSGSFFERNSGTTCPCPS